MCKLPVVEKHFASIAVQPVAPTGDDVTRGSYQYQETQIPLVGGKKLHVAVHGSGLKLTLIKDNDLLGTRGIKLSTISVETMEAAVEQGCLKVDSLTLNFENTRLVRRLLRPLKKEEK